ncbi:MAG: serine/threonine-protein kinase [Jatrophihabitans sp.]
MEFGRYEVLRQVGVGSTATVYQARHRELHQLAAIKELNPRLRDSPRALLRFRSEAKMLAEFDHPNIVTVYDFVEEPGRSWIAEEWVDGVTVETLLATDGALCGEQCLGVLRGALLGLAYAHERGVVHGDVAPSNMIADQAGTSKLVDFGVSAPSGTADVYGTPAFISPEGARGEPVGPSGDVYSAGAVLYLLLTGSVPFPAPTVGEVLAAQMTAPPPQLRGQGNLLSALVADSLAKDPGARPQDAGEFLHRLEEGAQEKYGPGWLERASIAGVVAATMGGAGLGSAVLAGAGGTSVAAGAGDPGTAWVAYGQSGIVTGAARVIRHGGALSPRNILLGLGLAAAVVVGGTFIALSGSDDAQKRSPLADQPAITSAAVDVVAPSATPSVTSINSIPLSGKYRIQTRIVSTNFENDHVGQRFERVWTLDLSCAATKCGGSVASSSGSAYTVSFDGQTLVGTSSGTQVGPCIYTSGPKTGKPYPGTRFKRTYQTTFTFTVTSRSDGPAPVRGTVLTLTGNGVGTSPKGTVLAGKCTNSDHARHEKSTAVLTYVSS